LARPGGNVTGLSLQATDIASKRFGFLREVLPDLRRVAIFADVSYPANVLEMGEVQTTARSLGLDTVTIEVRQSEDIAPAFKAHSGGAGALYVCVGPLTTTNQLLINNLALAARLPTICALSEYVHAGALMSYGPNVARLFRRAAEYVDKILHGAKPGDLPIEQPTEYDLAINLKTANALSLTIPHNLLVLADEVIE
jgi:putative tryptophan/tyrosine transport system substrate-binding protein